MGPGEKRRRSKNGILKDSINHCESITISPGITKDLSFPTRKLKDIPEKMLSLPYSPNRSCRGMGNWAKDILLQDILSEDVPLQTFRY